LNLAEEELITHKKGYYLHHIFLVNPIFQVTALEPARMALCNIEDSGATSLFLYTELDAVQKV